MKITQLSPNAYQLTQTFPFPINAYLIRESGGFSLVDTAMGKAKQILQAAAQLGGMIQRIFLTHAHSDHVGSLEELTKALPDTEILISRREARLLQGDYSLASGEPEMKVRGSYRKLSIVPSHLLDDGERVGSLQAVAAPGHTPGQMAFLDERDRSLFAGDALVSLGGLRVAGDMNWRFPFPVWATWHHETAHASSIRLASLRPRLLAVGHGAVLYSPEQTIREAIARSQRRIQKADGSRSESRSA
jgi:glyoxylase-like metal-dependent hydrolase (beta-lactamase superfamily II)